MTLSSSRLFFPEEGESKRILFLAGAGQTLEFEDEFKHPEVRHGQLEVKDGRAILSIQVQDTDNSEPEWVEYSEESAKKDYVYNLFKEIQKGK